MALPLLKSILRKHSDFKAWLDAYAGLHGAQICILDDSKELIYGELIGHDDEEHPIVLQDEIVGWVKGKEQAAITARLIALWLEKEAEKKKLGAEVLNLYQELNIIYNFSEKLTQTIDPDVIAQVTLEQAMHSIPAHSGVVVLWDEQRKQLGVPATAGDILFNDTSLRDHPSVLLKIGMNGQSEIINELGTLKELHIIQDDVHSLMYAAMKVKHRIMGAIILAGKDNEQFSAGHLKLLVTLALQSSSAIDNALLYEKNIREVREREEAILRIHEVTKKFVPNEFIRSLGKESLTDVMLGDQVEKIVTVLFTDIRDFTSLSEKMTPEENFHFVSSFNARLGPIIRSNHGFINQYLGDSIMAIFPEKPLDALRAGISMQQAVNGLNIERHKAGLPPIRAGIGMHTGPLIMGITGDEFRLDAATISDTVNTAARIESLTKYYRSSLLLSSATLRLIPDADKYLVRQLGKVQFKGKFKILSIAECLNGCTGEEQNRKRQTIPLFSKAMDCYVSRKFGEAIEIFGEIIDMDPDDYTSILFLNHATHLLRTGTPAHWVGALEMQTK
jgi:adenylate cyclase